MPGGAEPVRVAFVGTGSIARVHAKALAALPEPGAAIVAAADVDPDSLASFARTASVPLTCHDIPNMLEQARPDLVHLCTPPSTHHPLALACLAAGASVLVEKPPVISLRELDDLAAAEGAAGGGPPWLATVFQHRFGGGQRRLKALAADPDLLGRPLLAICNTTWFRGQEYYDVPWRGRWETEGGGPTMGHGIHQMDMLADVLGDWSAVSAVARTQARRIATEDLSLAHVAFTSGAVASIVNSVLSPREESYLRFDFEHATVEVRHLYGYADEDWRVTPAPGYGKVLAAWEQAAEEPGPGEPAGPGGGPGARSGHAGQFSEVLAAIRDGRPPPVTLAQARRTMTLIAAIYASAVTGKQVRPGDVAPGSPFYDTMSGRRAGA